MRTLNLVLISFALALYGSVASAQSLEEEQAAAEGEATLSVQATDEEEVPGDADTEEGTEGEAEPPAEIDRPNTDPHEEENVDYFFLGAFYRHIVIPGAIQDLFVAGGIDGSNPGVGLTFNWRKNNFNIVANIWWANAQGEGFFRAEGDPRTDTEHIGVNLGAVFINAEFLWSFPIVDWFAIDLGFDLGFGFVYGDLIRTEAYETTAGSDDWRRCDGPGTPNGVYCEGGPAARDVDGDGTISGTVTEPPGLEGCYDSNGSHYNCREPNWTTSGGDTPLVMPWLALPHFALRFKPIRQVQIRIDVAYNLYAISFGGSISYGF